MYLQCYLLHVCCTRKSLINVDFCHMGFACGRTRFFINPLDYSDGKKRIKSYVMTVKRNAIISNKPLSKAIKTMLQSAQCGSATVFSEIL